MSLRRAFLAVNVKRRIHGTEIFSPEESEKPTEKIPIRGVLFVQKNMNQPNASDSSLSIRLATEADSARLIALVNSAYAVESFLEGTRIDEDRLAAYLRKGEILVMEAPGGRLVACIYLENRGQRGYLGMFAVDPASQGQWHGRKMVRAAEERLRKQGCEAIDIVVLSLRPELPPIYRRWGYRETGTEELHDPHRLQTGLDCHGIIMSKYIY
jgi:ribosomal protein S18 acetylase RimI-like enzyme